MPDDVRVFRATRSRPESTPPARAIVDGKAQPRPPAPPAGPGCDALFGNAAQNGRAGFPWTRGLLELRWTKELGGAFGVSALLAAGHRVYAAGRVRWALLDATTGEQLAFGPRGLGVPLMDAQVGLFYQPDADGQLEGLHLDAGQKVFFSPLVMNADFNRNWAGRVGGALVLLGVEKKQPAAENPHDPELSSLEALPVFPKLDVRPSKQLAKGTREPLLFDSPHALAAGNAAGVAVAFPNRVVCVDDSLDVTAVLKGEFEPLALSVDEQGVLHLIVDEERGRSLWIVRRDGTRTLRLALPKPFEQLASPPLVRHDHAVVLRAAGTLLCLGEDGRIIWARPCAPQGGCTLTADDAVLAADGDCLVVFDAEGQRSVLHRFDKETLLSNVVLQEGGDLTVAGATKVYRLRSRK